MATATLDELTAPLTVEELTDTFAQGLAARGTSTTAWKPGAVSRTMIAIVCVVLAALSTLIAKVAAGGFRGLATGAWQSLVARFTYGAERQWATFATGPVLLSNTSGSTYVLAAGDFEVSSSATHKVYRNTAPITINPGALNVPVTVQAVEVGSASSALNGEVDTVVSNLSGVTVTNVTVLAGLDDESGSDLDARCAAKLTPFSPDGPKDAYLVAARGAKRANGSPVGVNRVRTTNRGRCRLDVYCASPSDALAAEDLAAVDEAIQTQAVPQCVTADCYSAIPRAIDITYELWCYNTTGITEAGIKAAVLAALTAYMAAAPIGGNSAGSHGYLWHEDITTTIMHATVNGAGIRAFRANVTTPTAEVSLGLGEVPTLGNVTCVEIHRMAPPSGGI